MSRARVAGVLGATVGTLGAVGALVWHRSSASRRTRLRRSARIWRLTVRRGVHYAVVKVSGGALGDRRRQQLEERFAIRTATDVANELGHMKGALMKLGQLASVIADGLPEEARAALATLQADVPPMAPSLVDEVVLTELGARPDDVFLEFDPEPAAAASIGQVHRAVTRHGHRVAVKVQYPGAAEAITADLDNAELLYGLASAVVLPGLDPRELVDELRQRMGEELDYRLEANHQETFADRFAGHPFIRVPGVLAALSGRRVLTTDWADGASFAAVESGPHDVRQRYAEVLFRFAQANVLRYRSFNGDPHPGNYRFGDDGSVTFLDFGLVKEWDHDEFGALMAVLDPVLDHDPALLMTRMEVAGFLTPDHGLTAAQVWASVSAPYEPYLHDEFTFTPSFTADAMRTIGDPTGPHRAVLRALRLPRSFVILNRVLWGMGGVLGRLGATNGWRSILDEYRLGAPASTELGHQEAAWVASRADGGPGR